MADKRRARQGSIGGNFTPQQAKKLLALPIYAVLIQQAVPVFPGSSIAAPSGLVGVFQVPGYSCRISANGKTLVLPVWINGTQWEKAIVPVLLDPRWQSNNLLFQSVQSNNQNLLVNLIGEALAKSFHDAGYGPLE